MQVHAQLGAICTVVMMLVHACLGGFLTSSVLKPCRYMLNWVKIRVWEQEQWDAVIMIDVDVTVLGDLTHLFKLPTDFAAVPDNGKVWNRYAFCISTVLSVYKQPKGALRMHCKLGLHACSDSLLQPFQLLYCAHAHPWLRKINGKARRRSNVLKTPCMVPVCTTCVGLLSMTCSAKAPKPPPLACGIPYGE